MSGALKSALGIPARELRRQRRARLRKARQLRWRHRFKRLTRAVLAAMAIFLAALAFAYSSDGLGSGGIILTFFSIAAVFVLLAIFPRTPAPTVRNAAASDLATLACQTVSWLETRRASLPPQTQSVVDLLGSRLDEMSPRLASLSDKDPASQELRKLLVEHVPSLINSYTNIPAPLAHQPHAGSTPAAQLHAGLETAVREVENLGRTLASGELDSLAIRARYLDSRYDRGRLEG
jgi:hypothetical protein